jgi:purine-binding chemotaxis protein CheW
MSTSKTQLCTFTVADLLFGLEVTRVQEVLRFQPLTRVPLADRRIRGLINLRGQLVTAVDLRATLGLSALPGDELPMNVVIRGKESNISLLVDSIGDVIEVSQTDFERPPSTLKPAQRALLDAVYKLPGRLLMVLAPERIMESSEAHASSLRRGAVS